jgi:predicted GNAT family acetyltransferase
MDAGQASGGSRVTAAADLEVRDNRDCHRFEADLGEGGVAIAEYTLEAGKIVFTHTEVPPAHEGRGIGSALIKFALRSARERHLRVVPRCPFFADYIRRHVEEQDLLEPAWRAKLAVD